MRNTGLLLIFAVWSSLVSLQNGFGESPDQPAQTKTPTQETAASNELRVLCYNIHHGEGEDGKVDLQRIANVIMSEKPDIVALQELDVNTTRTGKVDQVAELEKLTGLNAVFGKTIDFQGGQYGLAILSRYRIIKHQIDFLPPTLNPEQRGILMAEVEIMEGKTVTVLCTHLCHRGTVPEKVAQAEKINSLYGDLETPAILAGDFNAKPNSDIYKCVAEKWTNATDNTQPTCGQPVATSKIDYIFYRPDGHFSLLETKVIDEPIASDHRPVLSVLELRP